jgi:hypothetical protein
MQFNFDLREVTSAVMKIYGDIDLTSFHQRVGEVVVSDIKRNVFDKLGYPSNTLLDYQNKAVSWPSLALSTMMQRTAGMRKAKSKQWSEKPSWPPPKGLRLQRTGNLRESINFRSTPNGVSIGSGMFYGKYLQARFPFLILTQSAMEEIAEQARLFFERVK